MAFQIPPLNSWDVGGRKLKGVQSTKLAQQLLRRNVVHELVLVRNGHHLRRHMYCGVATIMGVRCNKKENIKRAESLECYALVAVDYGFH